MGTFVFGLHLHLQLATLNDLHGDLRFVTRGLLYVLDLFHDVVPFEYLAKDNVAAVKPAAPKLVHPVHQAVGVSRVTNLVMAVVMKN